MSDSTDKNKESNDSDSYINKSYKIKILEKFKTYRTAAESHEKKLNEAQTVIEQLKNEVNISRKVQKHLKDQLQACQERSIQMQTNFNQLILAAEKQRQNEKGIKNHEKKINDINTIVQQILKKSKDILNVTSNEMSLIQKNNELKEAFIKKDCEFNVMKVELQTLTKEKMDFEIQSEQKLKTLRESLEESKREIAEIKKHFDMTLMAYQKQIEDNKQLIKEYEKERQSFLEEFELPNNKNLENSNISFTCADSTVSINAEEGISLHTESRNKGMEIAPSTPTFSTQPGDTDQKFIACEALATIKSNRSQIFGNVKEKPKQQIDFVITHKSTKRMKISPDFSTKRRLFSTNCNHYLN